MSNSLKVLFFGLLLSANVGNAQNLNPMEDKVYREAELTVIKITMSADDKVKLLLESNRYENIYVTGAFEITNSKLDHILFENVSIRLRGNTSRDHDKLSYKISFAELGGLKFEGYKSFNLKPNVNDPTLVRELLTMHLYRIMNVPAPRIAPTQLYINDEYMGVYLNVESIDDEFVDKRFGHEEGFLYKCRWGANLKNDGQVSNTTLYESEMNESTDIRSEFTHFAQVLNNTTTSDFADELEQVFAVDRYLRQMAVEALVGHWDGYSYNQNNYYLFYDGQTGLVEFLPYDCDNTWGIDWVGGDWANADLGHFPKTGESRPLSKNILNVPQYKNRYFGYLNVLFENYFNERYLLPLFEHYESLLAEPIIKDTYYPLAFDFDPNDFAKSFAYDTQDHVKYGLRGYLDERRASGLTDIPKITSVPTCCGLLIYPNPVTSYLIIENLSHIPNQILLFDTSGRLIPTSYEAIGSDTRISFIGIQTGIYYLTIKTATGIFSQLVIKE